MEMHEFLTEYIEKGETFSDDELLEFHDRMYHYMMANPYWRQIELIAATGFMLGATGRSTEDIPSNAEVAKNMRPHIESILMLFSTLMQEMKNDIEQSALAGLHDLDFSA